MALFTINKTYVLNNPNYSWLSSKMDDSFEIKIGSKSVVVFGYNGIGKTSLAKCLREDSSLNFKYLDYEEDIFDSEATSIVIAPNILKIKETENEIRDIESQIDFATMSKSNGFKKTKSKTDPSFIATYKSTLGTGSFPSKLFKDRTTYNAFISKYPLTKSKIFFDISGLLGSVSSSQTELENYKSAKWLELIEESKEFVDSSNDCPICGTHFDDLLSAIEKKKATIQEASSKLIETMQEKGYPYDGKTMDEYLKLFAELSKDNDLLNDYVVCGEDITKFDSTNALLNNLTKLQSSLASLYTNKVNKYLAIKTREHQFKRDVARYLKINESAIAFNDSDNDIVITLDREVSTYSTGERHILWFLYQIYSFVGSDSSILVMDDPASSLDLINLYKIAFEIVRSCDISDKNLLVFTHSTDLVNAINSQRQSFLNIYYIEELNGKLYCDEIQYKNSDIPNVFTIERLMSFNPPIAKSLKKREDDGPTSLEHLVYHFDNSGTPHESQIDSTLTNDSLINLIDSFVSFSKIDFYQDVFTKIYYLLALRVWLEKELFGLIPVTDSATILTFLKSDSISEKIDKLTSSSTNYLRARGIEKEDLMSKKVMLNQNAHYYSQVMPFAYAMNLSFDDLGREISELKALFA